MDKQVVTIAKLIINVKDLNDKKMQLSLYGLRKAISVDNPGLNLMKTTDFNLGLINSNLSDCTIGFLTYAQWFFTEPQAESGTHYPEISHRLFLILGFLCLRIV